MDSVRQNKSARLIQKELGEYFRMKANDFDRAMISVTVVRITPDLGMARCYLSIFNVDEPEEMLQKVRKKTGEIRYELGHKIRKQVRHIPELHFYLDDSLDYAEEIDELLNK